MAPMSHAISIQKACQLLEAILASDARREILAAALKSGGARPAMQRLRDGMRSHSFRSASASFQLGPITETFDSQIPGVGFHVLHDWDGQAERLTPEIIPVDLLQYFIGLPPQHYSAEAALRILFDYYFVYLLALLAVGAWREGDANRNLDETTRLLGLLQGEKGSGHQFVGNAETLIVIATSHFEPDENAYRELLSNVSSLDDPHRTTCALAYAAIMASHLRHGFEGLYKRDINIMREDNGTDYPWVFFSVATLMKEYARLHREGVYGEQRDTVVEGIINGLLPDARALVGKAPPCLAGYETERSEFCELFYAHKEDLLAEFEARRPSDQAHSPLSLNFNFPHNAIKGIVAISIGAGRVAPLPFNQLLTGVPFTPALEGGRRLLVQKLANLARSAPEIIRGRPVPMFSYDPSRGSRGFVETIGVIREQERCE
jgi:hypothetical protein